MKLYELKEALQKEKGKIGDILSNLNICENNGTQEDVSKLLDTVKGAEENKKPSNETLQGGDDLHCKKEVYGMTRKLIRSMSQLLAEIRDLHSYTRDTSDL